MKGRVTERQGEIRRERQRDVAFAGSRPKWLKAGTEPVQNQELL